MPRGVVIGVLDGDKTQRAGGAGLHRHVRDARGPRRFIADAQRIEKFDLAAGPHPARQRHRRQEAAARRVAVGAELRHRKHRLRQAPMRGPRRGVARPSARRSPGTASRADPSPVAR